MPDETGAQITGAEAKRRRRELIAVAVASATLIAFVLMPAAAIAGFFLELGAGPIRFIAGFGDGCAGTQGHAPGWSAVREKVGR